MDIPNKTRNDSTPLKIILVDDDPVFCRLAVKAAKKENISLSCFVSPKEAYHHLPDEQYDAVIIDYNLGIVNGFQLCNYLEHLGKRKPVILVSATDKMEYPDKSFIVKECVPKSSGLVAIFDSARRAVQSYDTNTDGF